MNPFHVSNQETKFAVPYRQRRAIFDEYAYFELPDSDKVKSVSLGEAAVASLPLTHRGGSAAIIRLFHITVGYVVKTSL